MPLVCYWMVHVNCIKKGSAHTLQGIVNTFDDYKKAHYKMVPKVLLIVLVLLWTMHPPMAKYNQNQNMLQDNRSIVEKKMR